VSQVDVFYTALNFTHEFYFYCIREHFVVASLFQDKEERKNISNCPRLASPAAAS